MSTRWVYVVMPRACFALAVRDGLVVDGPPIIRSGPLAVIGWRGIRAAEHLRRRGARFRDLG